MRTPKFNNSRTELVLLSAFFILLILFAAGRRFFTSSQPPAQANENKSITKAQPVKIVDESVDIGQTNDMLKAADVKAGASWAKECTTCHHFEKDAYGEGKVGPNLFGIVGARIARDKNYDYSLGLLKHADKHWTIDELDAWLNDPSTYAPGTKMTFAGMLDPQDRMDLIAYLMTLK